MMMLVILWVVNLIPVSLALERIGIIEISSFVEPTCNGSIDERPILPKSSILFRKCCPEQLALKKVWECSKNSSISYIYNKEEGDSKSTDCTRIKGNLELKTKCVPNKNATAQFIIQHYQLLTKEWKNEILYIIYGKCRSKNEIKFLKRWFPNNATLQIEPNNIQMLNDETEFIHDQYCFEYEENTKEVQLYVWKQENEKTKIELEQYIIDGFFIISMIFLFITFLVFVLMSKMNSHQQCIMNQVISLFFLLFFSFTKRIILVYFHNSYDDTFCKFIGLSLQFSLLICFFWMNIICFDMWWTLSGICGTNKIQLNENDSSKYRMYCLYAWGFPVLIVFATVCREFNLYKNGKTLFSHEICFFNVDDRILHFYGFIILLSIMNVGFFIATAVSLENYYRKSRLNCITKIKSSRRRLIIYLKMFVIMGCPWLFEFITANRNDIWFRISSIFISLQGVFIFIILVCRQDVYTTLNERFRSKPKQPSLTNYHSSNSSRRI